MRITFAGVGEAFDERLPNTSLLIQGRPDAAGRSTSILLDCGFTAAAAYWQAAQDPMALDAVWISHFHGDHFFGLPHLLLRFWEQGREDILTIVGQEGVETKVMGAMEMAYPGFTSRFRFPIKFRHAGPGATLKVDGLELSCAMNDHSQSDLAVRVDDGSSSLFYSGDGRPTEETAALARGVDCVVHESYALEDDAPGHGTVPGSIAFAREAGAPCLALVHVNRHVRHNRGDELRAIMAAAQDLRVLLPEPGDTMEMTP
jgi:ribonuclease BN (tRNA processing enzyme)